ncbi:hypothetical protein NAPIS_ORF02078 [Vairimorpha apis BRL 01]|uniref:Uncharacterized protein n=1 Tax=Vairimorpha apis BRL 01 TaxID=1037528 RepID=T0MAF0_9MICR|nr:hypothetical protein NAPIS_ORF02078 [Vairimorpha apis BRL 01]
MNIEKSATNSLISINDAVLMNNNDCYKYLGIIEDKTSKPTKANWDLITKKIKKRIDMLCKTNLNSTNLMRAINEYAMSLLNYYIGLLDIEPEFFKKLDHEIRQILILHGIHLQPACKDYILTEKN